MNTADRLVAPISKEMQEFEVRFKESMKSHIPSLDKITTYIIKRKGKQVRPMFLFLTAKMLGEVNDATYDAANLVELLHNATLVHDDVVDDANERRGFFSVNALWKNKVAVLVGDYLLSQILLLSLDKKQITALQIVATAVREMAEGELLQIEKARKMDITEEIYFEVIRKKTASLISACCEAAAVSVGREDMAKTMHKFGELVGLAFQIKDDIFDYGDGTTTGKPAGLDIRERKMTLPLIYALNTCSPEIKKELINIVKRYNEDSVKVKRATELVINAGGIIYATKRMEEIAQEAKDLLINIPESIAKKTLIELVDYTMSRTK
jgi:octaprenyl-diphosphate synthase